MQPSSSLDTGETRREKSSYVNGTVYETYSAECVLRAVKKARSYAGLLQVCMYIRMRCVFVCICVEVYAHVYAYVYAYNNYVYVCMIYVCMTCVYMFRFNLSVCVCMHYAAWVK